MQSPTPITRPTFSGATNNSADNSDMLKWKFEVKTMVCLNKSTNALLATKSFPVPHCLEEKKLLSTHSTHTSPSEHHATTCVAQNSLKNYHQALVIERLNAGECKIRNLLEIFSKIEKRINPLLSKHKAKSFRSSLSKNLGSCLAASVLYEILNTRQIALAILYISCQKSAISESLFIAIVRRVTKYRIFSTHQIHTASWYKSMKKEIQVQRKIFEDKIACLRN